MARAGIRYEDVEKAAEALARAHINPTHERIRHALGGGSFSTIGRHLQTWRQSCAEEGSPAEDTIPPDSLVDAVKGVWQGMRGATEARVAEVQAAAEAAIEEAQSTARAQVEALKERHAQALGVLEAEGERVRLEAQSEAVLARQRIEDAAAHHDQARQSLRDLEAAHRQSLVETAEAQGRAQALTDRVAALEDQLRATQQAHTGALDQAEVRYHGQIEQVKAVHREVLAQLAQERDAKQLAQTQAVTHLQRQMAQLQAETEHWQTACGQADSERKQMQGQLERMRAGQEADHKRLQRAEKQAADHHERAQKHEAALYTLRGETQGRVHVIEELREAFNALAGERLLQRSGDD